MKKDEIIYGILKQAVFSDALDVIPTAMGREAKQYVELPINKIHSDDIKDKYNYVRNSSSDPSTWFDPHPTSYTVRDNDVASLSKLVGTVLDKKNNSIGNILPNISIFRELKPIINDATANKSSWDALSKAFKDSPEILDKFSRLRGKLTKAQFNYTLANHLPALALGTYGAYRGWKYGRKLFDKKKHPILSLLGGTAGLLGGGAIGGGLGHLASSLTGLSGHFAKDVEDIRNTEEYKNMSNKLNAKILEHSRTHEYYSY